jgi:hypothetical protein
MFVQFREENGLSGNFLTSVWEVPGSNLGRDIGYTMILRGFARFSSGISRILPPIDSNLFRGFSFQ